jgi:hypothetical protein
MTLAGGIFSTGANFSAQTRNPLNAFSSGALVLSDTKSGNTACLSTAGGATDTNVNNSCDQLFNLTVRKPGDTATARLALANVGSLNATALKLYSAACTNSDATGETYHGTGDMCGTLILYVQQFSDNTYTTKTTCVYGGGSASTCDYSNAAKTLSNFVSSYTSGSPAGLGALNAGAANYYEIGISFPSTAGNSLQGRTATFDFTWMLQQ